jgi:hypothetical protein
MLTAKVRDMAKITPLRKETQMTNVQTTRKVGNPNNPGFKQWLAARHSEQLNLQDIILVALAELHEPVSTQEMQRYLKNEADIDLVIHRVKYALEQLVLARKISVHLETPEERKLRANGVHTSPKPAYLFNSGTTPRARTITQVVEGYRIFDVAEGAKARAGRPRKARKSVTKPIGAPEIQRGPSQGEAIDYLIEKIVSERTRDLQAQLNEANAKLAQFKKLLS